MWEHWKLDLLHCFLRPIPLRSHSPELVPLCLLQGTEALFHAYPDPGQLEMF